MTLAKKLLDALIKSIYGFTELSEELPGKIAIASQSWRLQCENSVEIQ